MANTHLSIYKKYIQARYEFTNYTSKFIDNVTAGIKTREEITKYNIVASWLDFIQGEIPEPINRVSTAPDPISFTIEPFISEQDLLVNIFIINTFGIRELIATVGLQDLSQDQNQDQANQNIIAQINNTNNFSKVTYDTSSSKFTIHFLKGSRYNGGSIVVTNAETTPGVLNIFGGSDTITTQINLTSEELDKINEVLDKIAIDLSFTYSDKEYMRLIDIEKSLPVNLKDTNNLTLTTEKGSTLEI
tara:strand:+ start:1804 stop:2541 length:738 start_codon:yes stop_codon:yes gene_type:complete